LNDAVDDIGEARIGVARAIDAANIDLGVGLFGGAVDDADAGRQRDHVIDALYPGRLDRRGGKHRDRGRHVLQAFGALAGGDLHLFDGR
jgi:hypothetical protein